MMILRETTGESYGEFGRHSGSYRLTMRQMNHMPFLIGKIIQNGRDKPTSIRKAMIKHHYFAALYHHQPSMEKMGC